jgi:hypothetical protein
MYRPRTMWRATLALLLVLFGCGCAGRCRSWESLAELRSSLEARNDASVRAAFAQTAASRGWTLAGPLNVSRAYEPPTAVEGRAQLGRVTVDGRAGLVFLAHPDDDGCDCGEHHCATAPPPFAARDARGVVHVLRPVVRRTRVLAVACGACTQGCGTPQAPPREGATMIELPTANPDEVGDAVDVPITLEQIGLGCERSVPAA